MTMARISYTEGYDDQSVLKQLWDDRKDIEDIQEGVTDFPTVDTALSQSSRFPVENQVITSAIDQLTTNLNAKQDASEYYRKIYFGSTETPSPSLGEDGDIYIYLPQ